MTSVVSFPSAGIGINMDEFGSKEEENSSGMRGKGSEADNCCDAWCRYQQTLKRPEIEETHKLKGKLKSQQATEFLRFGAPTDLIVQVRRSAYAMVL